jgi:beta-galactosidase
MRWKSIAALSLLVLPCLAAARSVVPLNAGWEFYPVRDFAAWPAQPQLTAAQIAQLKIPSPGKGWEPAHLPDDYVVRGQIAREPNASLLAGGAVCPLGARECSLPGSEPESGKPGQLNRPGRNAYAGHGYLPVYPAWYRRVIPIPASSTGKAVWLDFGGVYRDAVVFVNGKFIAQHAGGYTGFRLNITSAVRYGEENSVAVFVDPRWFEGWWYEGGGIYRDVRLITTDPLQIAPWGTFVNAQVTDAGADLKVDTTIRNDRAEARRFTIVSQIVEPSGRVVASRSSDHELAGRTDSTFSDTIALRDPLLWSLEKPNLYRLNTTVRMGESAVDEDSTTFGIRSLRFDPNEGFFLNGKRVEIHGVCAHHDFPGVGIAAAGNLWEWRIRKLQAMGANAYRTAHNPVSEEFYEAADRLGMLVMDETRHLGDTYFPKAIESTPYTDLADVKAMVLQHRNHPSIIMWSLANEEGQGPKPLGAKMFAASRDAARKLDPTRPTTGAVNGGYTKEGYISVEDILGMNYHNGEFAKNHATFPHLMIFGSEDTNAKTSRGTLETSRETGLCSQYACDTPAGGDSGQPWKSWVPVTENRFVAGQFIWTAFDYRGEPNPFSWPAVTSQVGAMDLCGFPKPVYHYWKAAWDEKPSVFIFPDWNLPKTEIGKPVRVRAFSNCDRVELVVNGKSQGAREMPRNLYLEWDVPYAPGTLTAIGYREGHEAARYTVETAGAPAALRLTAETGSLAANAEDVAPIRVEVLDAQGRVAGDADNPIRFSISGAGTLAGVGNGNPASPESNIGSQRKAFHGLAMVLVRAGEVPGEITVTAESPGLKAARLTISVVNR